MFCIPLLTGPSNLLQSTICFEHLETGLEQPENDIFFIGYQVRGTPGYDIIKYGGRPGGYVRLNTAKVSVRANPEQLPGYSAHADQNGFI